MALVIAGAMLTLVACADTGTTQAQQQEPSTRLKVTFRADDGAAALVRELTCDPPGGDHPDPQRACQALADVPDPFAPPPKGMICTEIYGGPERATVEGTWRGKSVRAEFSRTNGCEIARWDRLRAVLRP